MTTFYVLDTSSGVKVEDRIREVEAERRFSNNILIRGIRPNGTGEARAYDAVFGAREEADAALLKWLEKRERSARKRWETARDELNAVREEKA